MPVPWQTRVSSDSREWEKWKTQVCGTVALARVGGGGQIKCREKRSTSVSTNFCIVVSGDEVEEQAAGAGVDKAVHDVGVAVVASGIGFHQNHSSWSISSRSTWQ